MVKILMNKSYSELITIPDYLSRFNYLKLGGKVGDDTFGYSRYLNQTFYRSYEWKKFREKIIIRDNGCDLGIGDYEIVGRIYIHHINPITLKDIQERSSNLLDPENVICVSNNTHEAIHYGDESLLFLGVTERRHNDTCPWK